MTFNSAATFSKESILVDLVHILEDITMDWDFEFDDSIGIKTNLVGDLGFESIDVVQFVVAIEEHYKCRGIPFEEFLMRDGRYVDEVTVSDAVEFLHRKLENFEATD